MAKLTGPIQFEGSIQGITVYKRRDIEQLLVRATGHPSSKQVKKGANFVNTRRTNSEFGGRSKCSSYFNKTLKFLKPVCGENYMGTLNGLLTIAQKSDTVSELGRRSVLLSKNRAIVDGYVLNQRNPFESILSTPLSCSFNREGLRISVSLPAFIPGRNFKPIGTFPVYRVIIACGLVPDFYIDETKGWHHNQPFVLHHQVVDYSPWRSVHETTEATTIDLAINQPVKGDDYTVLVAAGISFGLVKGANYFKEVTGAGCGKVILAG